MSSLFFCRTQFAIGQGGFHATRIFDDYSGDYFTFVYDCGSLNATDVREREIDEFYRGGRHGWDCCWRRWAGHPDRIDLVVLSHIDADHVNGLARLLEGRADRTNTLILLPYLEWWDRLAQFDSHADGGDAAVDMVADPAEYLRRTQGVTVLTVSNEQPELPEEPEYVRLADGAEGAAGAVYVLPGPADGTIANGATLKHWRDAPWVFKVFVPSVVDRARDEFVDELVRLLPGWDERLRKGLDPEQIRELLMLHAKEVRAATKKVSGAGGPNATSLIVYSGPDPDSKHVRGGDVCCFGPCRFGCECEGELTGLGWLHTGDAPLGERSLYEQLRSALARYLPYVGIVTLPHHGSRHGFSWRLIDDCAPRTAVACSGPRKGWKHPEPELWHALALRRIGTVHVSRYELSRLHEWGSVHW
jgi:glyoxylase-like metal-dependent hydrolase (beta-lactamase superfamily II)